MDPLVFIAEGIKGLAGPVFGFFAEKEKAGVAREQIGAKERMAREMEETRRRQIEASLELGNINAGVQKDRIYYGSQNIRGAAFYTAKTVQSLGFVVLGVAGVGAIGAALYYANGGNK